MESITLAQILFAATQFVQFKTQVEGKYNPLVIEALDDASPNHIQLIVQVDTKNSDEMDLLDNETLIPQEKEKVDQQFIEKPFSKEKILN